MECFAYGKYGVAGWLLDEVERKHVRIKTKAELSNMHSEFTIERTEEVVSPLELKNS